MKTAHISQPCRLQTTGWERLWGRHSCNGSYGNVADGQTDAKDGTLGRSLRQLSCPLPLSLWLSGGGKAGLSLSRSTIAPSTSSWFPFDSPRPSGQCAWPVPEPLRISYGQAALEEDAGRKTADVVGKAWAEFRRDAVVSERRLGRGVEGERWRTGQIKGTYWREAVARSSFSLTSFLQSGNCSMLPSLMVHHPKPLPVQPRYALPSWAPPEDNTDRKLIEAQCGDRPAT